MWAIMDVGWLSHVLITMLVTIDLEYNVAIIEKDWTIGGRISYVYLSFKGTSFYILCV